MADTKSFDSKDPRVQYCAEHSVRLIPAQEKLIEVTKTLPMRIMLGSPDEMQLLMNLLKMIRAKKAIDVGVYTGYSALCVALALPEDGTVVACDVDETCVNIGKPFWKEAGVEGKIDVRIAPASQTLQSLIDNGEAGTYDYVFIDADKTGYDDYYEKSLVLLRPGGFMAIDNALLGSKIFKEDDQTPATVSMRKLNDKIKNDQRVSGSLLTIGDGTYLVFKPY